MNFDYIYYKFNMFLVDILPPIIKCPNNVKGNTIEGKNYGLVTWSPPIIKGKL